MSTMHIIILSWEWPMYIYNNSCKLLSTDKIDQAIFYLFYNWVLNIHDTSNKLSPLKNDICTSFEVQKLLKNKNLPANFTLYFSKKN